MGKGLMEEGCKRGWSEKEVWERVGLWEVYVGKIERGRGNAGRERMVKLETVY